MDLINIEINNSPNAEIGGYTITLKYKDDNNIEGEKTFEYAEIDHDFLSRLLSEFDHILMKSFEEE